MSITKRIKQIREDKGLTQAEFANKIGMKRGAYSMLELGKGAPSLEILVQIAKIFGTDYQWLLEGKKVKINAQPNAQLNAQPIVEDDGDSYTKRLGMVVDTHGMKLVPITDIHAAAGEGYINAETIDENDVLRLPAHMIKSGNHLCIRIKGVSMAPTLQDGGYVIIRHLDRGEWMHMPNERIYVVVDNDGKTYLKRVKNRFSGDNGFIVLTSDSPDKMSHPTFNLHPEEIAHIWYVEWYFTAKMPNIHDQYYSRVSNLEDKVDLIQEEFLKMKKQLK